MCSRSTLLCGASDSSPLDTALPEKPGKSGLEGLTKLGQRDRELSLNLDVVCAFVDHADARPRQSTCRAHAGEAGLLGARHRDQHSRRRFGEQGDERIGTLGKQDAASCFAGQCRLDDSLRKSALGQVVRSTDQPVTRTREQNIGEQLFASATSGGTPPRWSCST